MKNLIKLNFGAGFNVKQNIAKYLKKNVLLIASVALCGFVLFLCSAGSDSNVIEKEKQADDVNQTLKLPARQTMSFLSDDPNFPRSPDLSGTEIFYKIMFAVVLIIALGAAAIFMTKKFLPKIAKLQGREIRVIETVHLGPRKSVHLIEIGTRRLLIGSTNENIRKLADLTEFSSDMPNQENEFN